MKSRRMAIAVMVGIVAVNSNVRLGSFTNKHQSVSAAAIHPHAPKTVYLTFDDGPDPVCTPLVLDALAKERVHATFFVVGLRAAQSPSIIRRMYREGHEIGNHGYYHTFIVHKSAEWVTNDVRRTDAVVEALSGARPEYFRPPGGILSRADAGLVTKIGHPIAMWTVDTQDWQANSAKSVVMAAEAHVRPGSIILMHDGIRSTSLHTAKALPTLIADLRRQGYTFAVLPKGIRGEFIGGHTDSTNRRFSIHS